MTRRATTPQAKSAATLRAKAILPWGFVAREVEYRCGYTPSLASRPRAKWRLANCILSHGLISLGLVALIGGSALQAGTLASTAPTNALTPQLTLDLAMDQPAQVVFQYPTNGMVFSAPYTGTVFLSDYGQAGRLDFFVNGVLKGTTSDPFLSLTLSNLAAGNYTLTGIATDNQGAKATNAITIAVVNDIPPTIILVSPTNDSVFPTGTAVTLQVSAADSDGTIQRVEFYQQPLCGVAPLYPSICPPSYLGSSTNSPFNFILTNPAPGFYHLFSVAIDNAGVNTRSDSIRIIVANSLRLTLPSRASDGSFSFHVQFDPPVSALNVFGSTNLVDWTLLPLGPPIGDNNIVFKDTDAPQFSQRFYRVQPLFQEFLPP